MVHLFSSESVLKSQDTLSGCKIGVSSLTNPLDRILFNNLVVSCTCISSFNDSDILIMRKSHS